MCEKILNGVPASPGLAVGPAVFMAMPPGTERSHHAEHGREAIDRARRQARTSLEQLRKGEDRLAADILDVQLALLDDPALIGPVHQRIADGEAAELAWRAVLDLEIADYLAADDAYMAARAEDLVDLRDRVLNALDGAPDTCLDMPEGAILLANDLAPSTFLQLDRRLLGGIALHWGSPASHVALLARGRGLPMVVELEDDDEVTVHGDVLLLDGQAGRLTRKPAPSRLAQTRNRLHSIASSASRSTAEAKQRATTRDGCAIDVMINVDDPAMLEALDPALCDGVGLTRTEFLFGGGKLPGEDEQAQVYEKILRWAAGRPVIMRTLDAGGDKPVAGLTDDHQRNPFLGVRGLRLSLARPDVFKRQLRALARTAAIGPLKVMLPMVTLPAELAAARAHLDQALSELSAEGAAFARPALGIMVETPVAALMAERFDADFYSIGSNDLIHYLTASARDDAAVAHLADQRNPALLELIKRVVSAGRSRDVPVSICGDMASDPAMIKLLLDQGLRSLSVPPQAITGIKQAIREIEIGTADGRHP